MLDDEVKVCGVVASTSMADAEDLEAMLDFCERLKGVILLSFKDFERILLAASHELAHTFLRHAQFLHLVKRHYGNVPRLAKSWLICHAPIFVHKIRKIPKIKRKTIEKELCPPDALYSIL